MASTSARSTWPELRRLSGLVLQDVHVFSGPIGGNIRLGEADIDDERVRAAANAVHADRFIARLPAGIRYGCRRAGATLSTGQKQLLSFARALAFDPRVLILDEATSSVDTENGAVDPGRAARADGWPHNHRHRASVSTIQDVDKILVLHKGQLRESGTHQELLALRGIYYRLYQLQYKDQERLPDRLPGIRPLVEPAS